MDEAMLSKSLIQFSVDGWGCVPSLLFDLRPNYGGGNEDNGDLLQKIPCMHCYTQCPQSCSSHRQPTPPPETPGHSLVSLGQDQEVIHIYVYIYIYTHIYILSSHMIFLRKGGPIQEAVLFLFYYWSIIALQCCVNFSYTIK